MQKMIRTILVISFSFLLIFSTWKVIDTLHAYRVGKNTYATLEQYVSFSDQAPAAEPAPEEEPAPVYEETQTPPVKETINWPHVDFEELSKINPDVVGWIYIEGTNINYPIAQASDNDYYMTRLFDGAYNYSGSIFLDASASSDFSDKHSIIFGHNMKDNTMFSALMHYKEPDFYQEHPNVLLLTPTKNYRIQLFSGYITDTNFNSWQRDFEKTDYAAWLSQAKSHSLFVSSQSPGETDRIVTLSTCSYEYEDAKFVLHGYIAYSE